MELKGITREWDSLKKDAAARAASAAPYVKEGKIVDAKDAVALLEAVIKPGDKVNIEGNNQKQADFLAKTLCQVDPGKVHDLHMVQSVLTLPEHLDVYEKGILLENKTVHVNARIGKGELVQELKKRGFRFVTKRKDNVEELWNLSDGINSPCEEVVQNIVEQIGVKQYQTQCKNALYLNMGDLKLVTNNIPGLVFHSFKKKLQDVY